MAVPRHTHTRARRPPGPPRRLDVVTCAPDPALTTLLEALASLTAGLASVWGISVPGAPQPRDPGRQALPGRRAALDRQAGVRG
ncbi:MAG: hypothetical protein NVS3B12_05310 [Acidimicrobiales bacterium]